jgi:hypothetical protein
MAKRSLDTLRVLTPCPLAAEFQEPVSHSRVCGPDVLSAFTREEAAKLLSTSEPPCVRFLVREDRPVFREAAIAAGVAATLFGAVQAGVSLVKQGPELASAIEQALEPRDAPQPPPHKFRVTGGVIARDQEWH